ncbi:hypothetical protein NLI92_002869 [Priestia megaterium]|uniref:hypothetical protein n=1 Tax=Priestia megaterium TaxID=1404 RepID=UPI0021ACCA8B|nr:hypothetical protein [Priestia megaterium]MCR8927480.1 hypothetical protein [Priestia megaterium]
MKFVCFFILFVFIFGIHTPVYAQKIGPFTIKQREYVDLNGDGRKEFIELFARKSQYHEHEWKLVVNGKEVAVYDNKDKYILAKMEFTDLLHNGKQDILLYFQSGDSGGTTGLIVFRQDEKKLKQIFTDPIPENIASYYETTKKRFSMKYHGNYQVEFVDKQTGLAAIIPLSKERYKDYPSQEIIQNLLEKITTWVDPVSDYHFDEVTKNKPKEIVTVQRVSGISHVDVIARYETRYVFNNEIQKYVPAKVALYSNETGKQLAEKISK